MAILLARNSDTPTVNNSDFTRMTRNSCLGYDGVTKGYGLECAFSSAASSIKIGSGEMVVQGWQVLITANGEILAIDNLPDKRYYSLYLEIDLSQPSHQTAIFKVVFSLSAYPVIDKGNDLTTSPSGIARLLVAHFTAQNGIISSLVSKVSVFGSGDAPTQVQSDRSNKIANTEYVRQAISDVKNITCAPLEIELGYSSGATIVKNEVKRQVNFVLFELDVTMGGSYNPKGLVITFPLGYRPKSKKLFNTNFIHNMDLPAPLLKIVPLELELSVDGRAIIPPTFFGTTQTVERIYLSGGFEIE